MGDTKTTESNETKTRDLTASKENLLSISSTRSEPSNQTQSDPVDVIYPSNSADENDNDHQFDVRFIRRPRHRSNVIRDAREKKHEPEIAVVKPHDLTVVHALLVALISREQQCQQKPVVTWESVQRRYHSMVCDLSSADRDLLLRYQPDLGFFPEVMDEQLLDVWTGKKSLLDLFSLPEFSDIDCVREPLPPYGLLVLLNQSQRLPQDTSSIGIGTDENDELPSPKPPRRSRKSKRAHVFEEEPTVPVAPLLRPSPRHCSESDISTTTMQAVPTSTDGLKKDAASETSRHVTMTAHRLICNIPAESSGAHGMACTSAQSDDIPPEAVDLPNPLAFFGNSAGSNGSIEAAAALRNSQTANRDGVSVTSLDRDTAASSYPSEIPTSRNTSAISYLGHSKDNTNTLIPVTHTTEETDITERLSELHIPKRAVEEISPFARPVEVQDRLISDDRKDVRAANEFVSSMSQSNTLANLVMSPLSNSSSESTASGAISLPDSFNRLTTQRKRSVLDGVAFPETNDEVKKCLDAIQEAASVCLADSGALLQMEAVLSELGESRTNEWIDYVLMYLPQFQVLPCNGQIFLAWKGM